jgi:hypothetical protein
VIAFRVSRPVESVNGLSAFGNNFDVAKHDSLTYMWRKQSQSAKSLRLRQIRLVEAAGVGPGRGVENRQVIDSAFRHCG